MKKLPFDLITYFTILKASDKFLYCMSFKDLQTFHFHDTNQIVNLLNQPIWTFP